MLLVWATTEIRAQDFLVWASQRGGRGGAERERIWMNEWIWMREPFELSTCLTWFKAQLAKAASQGLVFQGEESGWMCPQERSWFRFQLKIAFPDIRRGWPAGWFFLLLSWPELFWSSYMLNWLVAFGLRTQIHSMIIPLEWLSAGTPVWCYTGWEADLYFFLLLQQCISCPQSQSHYALPSLPYNSSLALSHIYRRLPNCQLEISLLRIVYPQGRSQEYGRLT